MDIGSIIHALTGNQWVQLGGLLLGVLYAIDQLLSFIAPFTPWTWDDRVVAVLGRILASLGKKK